VETLVCTIQGMHCAACAQKIEKALLETKGIHSIMVNFSMQNATIFYEPGTIDEKKIFKIITK